MLCMCEPWAGTVQQRMHCDMPCCMGATGADTNAALLCTADAVQLRGVRDHVMSAGVLC